MHRAIQWISITKEYSSTSVAKFTLLRIPLRPNETGASLIEGVAR
jgi:hypothetical protein